MKIGAKSRRSMPKVSKLPGLKSSPLTHIGLSQPRDIGATGMARKMAIKKLLGMREIKITNL